MNEQILVDQVEVAATKQQALNIKGGDTKAFYGGPIHGEPLNMREYQGIIDYEPAELVLVARAGTSLSEINTILADNQQMLGFEPPFADKGATLGGAVASGLSGAVRPYRGGVRDYLLGAKIINGKAEVLQFGGKVMKNVAGFDLFRPMAGAMGTLGVLLELSLRVIPMDEEEMTISFHVSDVGEALEVIRDAQEKCQTLSASTWVDEQIILRLSGRSVAVVHDSDVLAKQVSFTRVDADIWRKISEFEHEFFQTSNTLAWVNVPPDTPSLDIPGDQLVDWGGARRFIKTEISIQEIRAIVSKLGGSTISLQSEDRSLCFEPLVPALMTIHTRFKQAFDPQQILNPDRLYTGL